MLLIIIITFKLIWEIMFSLIQSFMFSWARPCILHMSGNLIQYLHFFLIDSNIESKYWL